VIPSALMARGMSLGRSGADSAANVVSFALWESVKIAFGADADVGAEGVG